MPFETILYEKQEHKAVLTMNRPAQLNAVSRLMSRELRDAWLDFRDDPNLWVAILTAAGDRAFSTGADLKETLRLRSAGEPAQAALPNIPFGGMTKHIPIWKPMIAAVNGFAVGGGLEMALACDIRICAEHAEFGLPEVHWGLLASAGGTVRLPRSVPSAVAMKMILTGQRIDAKQALQWGLVTDVVPLADLMPLAHRIADTIVANAPRSVGAAKEIALRTQDMALEDAVAVEDTFFNLLMNSPDFEEGLAAFQERRPAVFTGNLQGSAR